jgi:hypothetical protein
MPEDEVPAGWPVWTNALMKKGGDPPAGCSAMDRKDTKPPAVGQAVLKFDSNRLGASIAQSY